MDDRGHLAQALIDRLRAEGLQHQVLGIDAAMQVAVAPEALAALPGVLARYCREFDLRLVALERREHAAWHAVFAWSDDVGRTRLLAAELFGDWCRGPRRLLRSEELLAARPDVQFAFSLLFHLGQGNFAEEQCRHLTNLWHEEPRGAMEQIARFWRRPSDLRRIAQAAKHGDWQAVRAGAPQLERAMELATPPHLPALAGWLGRRLLDAAAHPLADADQETLRWLESRVERRYPDALVGVNPPAARLLQFACRNQIPVLSSLSKTILNCDIDCELRAPILMPHPYGIVIEAGAQIGNRVTIMQQATIARSPLGEMRGEMRGAPVIEDNVTMRIGRGADIGPNAVVMRDVPSHCVVVVSPRREEARTVVNS
jgi:hypothetical protein